MLSICLCTLPLSQTPTILMLSVYCADTILMLSVCLCIHHHGTQSLPVQTPSWHSVFAYADTTLTLSVCLCRHHHDAQFYCADTILTLSVCLCRQHPDVQRLPVQTPPWRSVFACADSPSQRPLPSSSCLVSRLHASSYLENRDDGILPARFSASINFILLSGTSGSCNHKDQPSRTPGESRTLHHLRFFVFFPNVSVTFHVKEPLTMKNTLIFCWIFSGGGLNNGVPLCWGILPSAACKLLLQKINRFTVNK